MRPRKTRRIRRKPAVEFAIGYQVELRRASECAACGQIFEMQVPNNPTKHNCYVITDPARFSRLPPSTTRPSLRGEIRPHFAAISTLAISHLDCPPPGALILGRIREVRV